MLMYSTLKHGNRRNNFQSKQVLNVYKKYKLYFDMVNFTRYEIKIAEIHPPWIVLLR